MEGRQSRLVLLQGGKEFLVPVKRICDLWTRRVVLKTGGLANQMLKFQFCCFSLSTSLFCVFLFCWFVSFLLSF